MRHVRLLATVLMLTFGVCILTATLPGCSGTPIAETPVGENAIRYQQAVGMYSTTVETMTALNDARVITLQQAEEFERIRASASRLLIEWRAAVVARQPFSGWDSLESLLEEMIRLQIEGTPAGTPIGR